MNSHISNKNAANDTSLDDIINSFKHQPNIVEIKQHSEKNITTFNFKQVSINEIRAQI